MDYSKNSGKDLAEKLVEGQYLTQCHDHDGHNGRNGKHNFFCVDCSKGPICEIDRQIEHAGHKWLQVRKACWQDCVRVDDIMHLVDIKDIHHYTNNGAKIVYLHTRPQSKQDLGQKCETCERSLQNQFKFCSISCKFTCSLAKELVHIECGSSEMPSLGRTLLLKKTAEQDPSLEEVVSSNLLDASPEIRSFRKKARKGTPSRALGVGINLGFY